MVIILMEERVMESLIDGVVAEALVHTTSVRLVHLTTVRQVEEEPDMVVVVEEDVI